MRLIASLHGRGRWPDTAARLILRRHLTHRVEHLERLAGRSDLAHSPSEVSASSLAGDFGTPPLILPPTALESVLGPSLVKSCCAWSRREKDLAAAEEEMMSMQAERAELDDGLRILDVSPGHGGLARWIRARWSNSSVTGLAASEEHRQSLLDVLSATADEGVAIRLGNLTALGAGDQFDRIFAIEALPGDADLDQTLRDLAGHLAPGGRMLIQLACHRKVSYRFRSGDGHELWKGTLEPGSLIPATDLLPQIQSPLPLLHHWELSGEHYERTARAWLARLEANRGTIFEQMRVATGVADPTPLYRQWRLALLATAELFGFHRGQEWWLSQYLLGAPDATM